MPPLGLHACLRITKRPSVPGYLLKQEHVAIDGAAHLHMRSLLDKQQFADPQGIAEILGISSATWPLFGLLWPSGYHLAAAMALRPVTAGERILEIGCGLALASLVAHRKGAEVSASDCHPLAGDFLLANLLLNELPPLPYVCGNWNDLVDTRLQGPFDLIIGSDVLYERDESGVLARFISHHASATSEVLIVDPNRGNRGPFHRNMRALGYELEETQINSRPEILPAYKGRMLSYRRQGTAKSAMA
jgi:predicted nicotinamide N-methyase